MMEDSHFNSSYFWSTLPAVPGQVRLSIISLFSSRTIAWGVFNTSEKQEPVSEWSFTFCSQIENAMFLNKVKEQQEKNASFPHPSASHYQTALLTIPTSGAKTDGGGQSSGPPHHPPHSNQNMLPVPSTGIMTAGKSALDIHPKPSSQSPLHLQMHFHLKAIKPSSEGKKALLSGEKRVLWTSSGNDFSSSMKM